MRLSPLFDENYLMPGLLAGSSALDNSPDDVQLVILGVDLSEEAKKRLRKSIPSDRLMVIDAGRFAEGMPRWNTSRALRGARIGIGSLLPADLRRVVYIDADTFTRADLTPLFNHAWTAKSWLPVSSGRYLPTGPGIYGANSNAQTSTTAQNVLYRR